MVLEALEKGEREGGTRKAALVDDLPLFSALRQPGGTKIRQRRAAKGLHPDEMTPMQALAALYD